MASSTATWAYETGAHASEDAIAERLRASAAQGYPFLVAEGAASRELLGYACVSPYRPREGWRFVVEDSVYVAPAAQRRGVGSALLTALCAAAARCGFRAVVAAISVERDDAGGEGAPSVALHRAAGFALAGRLPAVGWKHGRWADCVFMQRELGAGAAAPPEEEALPPALRVAPEDRR